MLLYQTEVDAKSQPTDKLSLVSLTWCRRVGSTAMTLSEARDDAVVFDAIQRSIDHVNEAAVSHAQYIQKWSILPRDFSVPGGELGALHKNYFYLASQRQKIMDEFYVSSVIT